MTRRLIIGNHPGIFGFGFYLTKPGFDVRFTTRPDRYLINSDIKNEQVVMCGEVSLARGTVRVVTFPQPLPSIPVVILVQSSSGSQFEYPWPADRATLFAGLGQGDRADRCWATPTARQVTILNDSALSQVIYYMVLAQELL